MAKISAEWLASGGDAHVLRALHPNLATLERIEHFEELAQLTQLGAFPCHRDPDVGDTALRMERSSPELVRVSKVIRKTPAASKIRRIARGGGINKFIKTKCCKYFGVIFFRHVLCYSLLNNKGMFFCSVSVYCLSRCAAADATSFYP
jgi:hypothetical protein